MINKATVLRAFIAEKLAEQGLEAEDNMLNALAEIVTLEEGQSLESEEVRSIYLSEATDGKPSAKSIKLYNLMRISYHDLIGFLLKESAILFTEDDRLKAVFSVFNLLHEFYPKLTYTFNEQDAGILLALYESGKKEFPAAEIPGLYRQRYRKTLPETQLTRSLDAFVSLKVLRYLGEGKYAVREKMVYERH